MLRKLRLRQKNGFLIKKKNVQLAVKTSAIKYENINNTIPEHFMTEILASLAS